MSKKVILISSLPDDATWASRVSAQIQAPLIAQPDLTLAVEEIAKNPQSTIFLEASKIETLTQYETLIQDQLGFLKGADVALRTYLLSERTLSQSRDLIQSLFFVNFIEKPKENLEKHAELYAQMLQAMEAFLEEPVQGFLQPKAHIQKLFLNHTMQKQEAVEEVRQYLIAAQVPARIANFIGNATDELLMNALFDAPVDEFGTPLYSATARTQAREIPANEQVELGIGFDGSRIVLKVTDQFGSIDRQRLLNHVSANYKETSYTIKPGQAGAGLGLATVYNTGASLVYRCEQKVQTQVILTCEVFASYKEFKSQFKFFSARFIKSKGML